MKTYRIFGLFAASLAFCAVGVATASAETQLLAEWLVNGIGVTGTTATVGEGEVLLEDMGTGADFLCSAKFVGILSPNGEAAITLIEDLEAKDDSLNCIITAKGPCEEANGALVTVIPVNLPWAVLLVLMENGEFLEEIFSSGAGAPGILTECKALGIKVDDTCTGATQAQKKNVTGGVEGIFNENEAITPAGNCTIGGTGERLLVGDYITTFPAGLTVSSE